MMTYCIYCFRFMLYSVVQPTPELADGDLIEAAP
jgi:hypothetical protein